MVEIDENMSRLKFIAVGSAAIAAPLLLNLADSVEEANAAARLFSATIKHARAVG